MKKIGVLIGLWAIGLIAYCQDTLTLDEAIVLALKQNPNILLDQNGIEYAKATNSWAAAGRLPTVSLNGIYNRSVVDLNQKLSNGTEIIRNGVNNSVINVNGQFSYRLYNGKKIYIIKKRLDLQEELAGIGLQQDVNQTAYDVISKYIAINRLQKQRNAILETISFFEERVRLSKSRFEIGTAAKNDYLQSQVDLNVQRASELNLINNIELAKMDLNKVLARDPFTKFMVQDILIPSELPTKESMMQAIDSTNPNIIALKFNQKILDQLAAEIKTQQIPSLFANATASFNKNSSTAGFNLFTQQYGPQAGLSISFPIFNGPIVKQQLNANRIQREAQDIQIENVKQNLLSIAALAYQNFDNAKSQIALEEQNLEVIKEHNSISMERFRKASITTVELRQAQLNLVEAQNRIINARYTLAQSIAQVGFVMGILGK